MLDANVVNSREDVSAPCREVETRVGSDGDGLVQEHHRLPTDPETVVAEELRGVTVDEAEDAYVGKRRGEANGPYEFGTMRERARRTYGRVLAVDREARSRFSDPVAGMLTLVLRPTGSIDHDPVEAVDSVRAGMSACSRRIVNRVGRDHVAVVGVREFDSNGIPHAHLYVVGDGEHLDTLDLKAGVDAFVRATPGAVGRDHGFRDAVRWDLNPERTARESTGDDDEYGPVHPMARYCATGLPNLKTPGQMDPHQIRQGALEWASGSSATLFAGVARGASVEPDHGAEPGEPDDVGSAEPVEIEGLSVGRPCRLDKYSTPVCRMSILDLPDAVVDATDHVAVVVVDALRWDEHEPIRSVYPDSRWFRSVAPSTTTPQSVTSLFTGDRPENHSVDGTGTFASSRTLLSATDSVSLSHGTKSRIGGRILTALLSNEQATLGFHNLIPELRRPGARVETDGDDWLPSTDLDPSADADPAVVGDHDLAFVHDMVVHNSAPMVSAPADWLPTWDPNDEPRDDYRTAVRLSRSAHRVFLDRLRDVDVFEDTLFVVVADHGESLKTPHGGLPGHDGAVPADGVARVPLGLCHTAVDGTRVDTDANPRLIDVAPTIVAIMEDAGLGVDRGIGETDGVDLQAHDGPLTGMCRQSYASPFRAPDEPVEAVVRSDELDLRPEE